VNLQQNYKLSCFEQSLFLTHFLSLFALCFLQLNKNSKKILFSKLRQQTKDGVWQFEFSSKEKVKSLAQEPNSKSRPPDTRSGPCLNQFDEFE